MITEKDLGPAITTGPLYGHGVPEIDISDFPFMESVSKGELPDPREDGLNNRSDGEENVDYTELIQSEAFIGEYPLTSILEGITAQFEDYIGTEDTTNYVDTFYTQLRNSRQVIIDDPGEEHPTEYMDVLRNIEEKFLSHVETLFSTRLAVSFTDVSEIDLNPEDEQYIITELYQFFILDARKNFKTVITKDLLPTLRRTQDDRAFYQDLEVRLHNYSPLVIAVGPMEFLTLAGADKVHGLFESGRVVGNFLKKYSPKLYAHSDYDSDLKSHIVLTLEMKQEVTDGDQD